MTAHTYVVKGAPIPQPRPRFRTIPGGGVQAYTPAKHAVTEWRRLVREELERSAVKLEGGLDISLVFHLQRPKSHFGTGKNSARLKDSAPALPLSKRHGDVDNLTKAVLDEMNGTVFDDDSQVCSLHVLKMWAPQGAAGVYIQARQAPQEKHDE